MILVVDLWYLVDSCMCHLLKNYNKLAEVHSMMANFVSVEEQQQLLENHRAQKQTEEEAANARKKRAPHCKKRHLPTKGHPRGRCPDAIGDN